VALHYLDGFESRFRQAVEVSETLGAAAWRPPGLHRHPRAVGHQFDARGVRTADPAAFRQKVAARGVQLGAPGANGMFLVATNETMNRKSAEEIAAALVMRSEAGSRKPSRALLISARHHHLEQRRCWSTIGALRRVGVERPVSALMAACRAPRPPVAGNMYRSATWT
jgi:hypothetical protein